MSAPAALSLAKLLYPETQVSKLNKVEKIKFEKSWVQYYAVSIYHVAAQIIIYSLN